MTSDPILTLDWGHLEKELEAARTRAGGKGEGVCAQPGSWLPILSWPSRPGVPTPGSPSRHGSAVVSPSDPAPRRPPASRPGSVPAPPADLAPRRQQLQLQVRLPARPDQPQLHAVVRPGEECGPGGHADAVAAHGSPGGLGEGSRMGRASRGRRPVSRRLRSRAFIKRGPRPRPPHHFQTLPVPAPD